MPFDLDRKIGFFFAAAFAGTLFAISTAWLIAGRAGNQGPVILSGLIGVDGTDEICRGSIDIAGIQGRVKQPRLVSAATQSRSVSQSVPLENERGPAGSPSLLVPRAHAGERNFRHHVPHMMPAGMPDHRETGGSATFTEPAWIGAAIPDAENANQERQEHAPRQPVERSHSAAMRPDPGEQAGMPAPTHNNTAHHRVGQTHLSMPPRQALSGGPDHGSHEQKGGTMATSSRRDGALQPPSHGVPGSVDTVQGSHHAHMNAMHHDHGALSHKQHAETALSAPSGQRRILYYRNPMGLPDISKVPKKDSMGMDYVPVYADEQAGSGAAVTLSPARIQKWGVETSPATRRTLSKIVRGAGLVGYDDRRVTVVVTGVEGYADRVYVEHVGQVVRNGEKLFRISSNNTQLLQIEIARHNRLLNSSDGTGQALFAGGVNLTAADWLAPASGVVVTKKLLEGQRIAPGEELFRIADTSSMWVRADIAESELPRLRIGMEAEIRPHAYPGMILSGRVHFIYPDLKPETRTAQVSIETPNQEGMLKSGMYADVDLVSETPEMVVIPESSVIDDGAAQHVLVSVGRDRFEPRTVSLGQRAGGLVEVKSGVGAGEAVVTSAAFLIDSESKLQAALAALTQLKGAQ